MSDVLELERRGPVQWAWLNRPERRNALSRELLAGLVEFVEAVKDDAGVGAVVIGGRGPSFSAGGDITEMDGMTESTFKDTIGMYMRLAGAIRASPKAFVAAVNGHALAGGFELAILCDLRIAARSAQFGLPDTALGLSPTSGMTYLLPRLVGVGRALHLTLLGEPIDAAEAERIGLVSAVVDDGDLERAAQTWAETISSHPAVAVRLAKRAFHRAEHDFAASLRFEEAAEAECFGDPETRARLRAFVERKST
jgi:enoyl-CoA hydratase